MTETPGLRLPSYLQQTPVAEAWAKWSAALKDAGALRLSAVETVPAVTARGRVLAGPALARFSSPSYHACAMDGYAVRAADTHQASETNPVRLQIDSQARYVDTGDPLPEGCDAVVMIEDAGIAGPEHIELIAGAAPWQHVRPIGEDIAAGEMLLPSGWQLRGEDVAVLVSAGVDQVLVRVKPLVAIVPTGDEIIPLSGLAGGFPQPGQIVESNSLLAVGIVEAAGAIAVVYPVVPDDPATIKEAVTRATATADVVVVSAGSSAGSADHTPRIIAGLGAVVIHGVATRPGKPVILGIAAGKPVLGMPGYPVSAWLSLDNFLRPLLCEMLGLASDQRPLLTARLARRMPSPAGVREYLRVKVGRIRGGYVAAPLSRGAGVLSSLVRADGLVVVPEDREGFEVGENVVVELLRPRADIDRSLVAIGSHDMSLDVLADLFRQRYPGHSLGSANVGSLGGLQALSRGEAHLAGTHLLDETTGDYNQSYVARIMPDRRVALVCLALREQGLIVAKGNPLGLRGVGDLGAGAVRYVNRQRGSGTRVLLDYLLREHEVSAESISGYRHDVYTHLAVAAEVAAGADAGMGICAAAKAFQLDFVPLAMERYELAITEDVFHTPELQDLLGIIQSWEFAAQVGALGGYDTAPSGEVRWVTPGE